MNVELWELFAGMVVMCSILLGPTIWYSRTQAQRGEQNTKEHIHKADKDRKELVASVLEAQEKIGENLRGDVKELKAHLDKTLTEVYDTVRRQNTEVRGVIASEIREVKSSIAGVDQKAYDAREQGHALEKKLLQETSDIHKNFVTKEHLEAMIELKGKF